MIEVKVFAEMTEQCRVGIFDFEVDKDFKLSVIRDFYIF